MYLAIWLPQFPWQALRHQQPPASLPEDAQFVLEAHGITRQVIAVSPAALQDGVTTGESEAQARLRAPAATAVMRSPAAEQRLQTWMRATLDRFSDRCHTLPPDRWLLALEGMGLLGSPAAIARQVEDVLTAARLQPRLGLGPTRTASLLRTASAQGHSAPLAGLPLAALHQLPSADAHAAVLPVLERWGLRTLGEVAKLPARALRERLGRAALDCQAWARGEDRSLLPHATIPAPPDELGARFEPALEGYLPLLPWLERAFARHCAALEARDGGVGALEARLTLADGRRWQWRHRCALPHREPRRLLRQLETALAQQPPLAPIVAVALTLTSAPPRRAQAGLFGDAAQEQENLDRLIARLRELLGDDGGQRCGSPRLQDLHRNDRFTLVPYAPSSPPAPPPLPARAVPHTVRCLRALRPPPPIAVELPRLPLAGEPLSLRAALCRLPRAPRLRVRRSWGPWRASDQWWTGGAWSRDEWEVEFEGEPRRLCRLLYDRRARAWFLLGDYD